MIGTFIRREALWLCTAAIAFIWIILPGLSWLTVELLR